MARKRRQNSRPSQPTLPSAAADPVAADQAVTARSLDRVAAVVLLLIGIGWLALFITAEPDRRQAVRPAVLTLLFTPDTLVDFWFGGFQQPSGFLDRLPILGVASLLLLAGHELGAWLLRGLKLTAVLAPLERGALATGSGLNLISLYCLLIGLAGMLSLRWLIVVPVLLGALATLIRLGIWFSPRWRAPARGEVAAGQDERSVLGWLTWLALFLAGVFTLMIVLGGMLPPWDFDVREYHLQAPKEWWRQGQIGFMPHNVYANMPLGSEMLALAAMAFMPGEDGWWLGALAGKLTMACYAPLTGVLLFAAGRRWFTPSVGAWAAVIWLAQPWVVHTAVGGLNEPAVAYYVLAALYAFCLRPLEWRTTLWSGFLAGGAAACKYPALLYAAVPLGMLTFALPDGASAAPRGFARTLRSAAQNLLPGPRWILAGLFAIGVLAGGGAWYVKNAALAGNPVYPLAYDLFGGETRTPEKNDRWERAHQVPRSAAGARYSFAQLRQSLRQLFFADRHASPMLLPLLLIAATAAVTRWFQRTPEAGGSSAATHCFALCAVVLLLAITAVWWLATHRIERFWLPALPLAALFAARAVDVVPGRSSRLVTYAFLLAGVLYCALLAASPLLGDNRWFVALSALRVDEVPPNQYSRMSPGQRWLNEHAGAGQSVLLVGDAAPLDLKPQAYYNTCFDDCLLAEWSVGQSARERRRALTERKIALVYVDWGEIARYHSPGNYGYDPRWTRKLLAELIEQKILTPAATLSDDGRQMVPLEPTAPLPHELRATIYRVTEP